MKVFVQVHCCSELVVMHIYIYDLVPKGVQMGVRFLTVNKICFKYFVLVLLCVCIHQYHSGNNMSSKSEAAGEILFFESEKCHEIRPLKTGTLMVSTFNAFIHVHDESKHYLSH